MSTSQTQMELPLSNGKTSQLRAGSLRSKEAISEAIKKALRDCGLDREAVAREVSRLTGDEFSIHTLNNMCADGKQDRRFPLEFAKALTMITGDLDILRAALQPEFDLMDEKGRAAHDYGVMMLENQDRSRQKRLLEQKARSLYHHDNL